MTVTDNVPGATIVCTPPAGSTFPLGSTPVSCVATDTTGNTATNGFTVVVEDREPPAVVVPANITVPNDPGLYSAVVNFAVSVTDNVPGASVACVPTSGSIVPVGASTVVCIASDAAGNKATNSFTVTVEDKEKPVLTLPAAISTVAEPGKADAVINFVVTATDNSGSATVTCAPLSGSAFPIGVTTVHCQATDAAGNTATGSFTVTIIDAELPVITGPGSTIVPTDPGTATAVVNFTVTVSDNAPGATVVCVPPSGSNFPLGVMTVTCTAMDTSGNQATTSFTVTVLDREPPTASVPANIVVPNTPGQSTATVNYTATVHDNLPGATLVCTPPSGSAFTIGSTIVICIGTDTAGNKATNSFTVTVEDRESPTLNLPANIIRMVGPGQDTAVVDYTVSATDNSGSATVTCVPPSGSAFPVGVTIVTCTAKDGTGNTSSGSFTITVTTDNNGDDQPPVITVPPNLIVPTDPGQYSAVVNYTATVSDNQPGATLVCLPPPGTAFPAGSTTVTCIATDAAGNKATNSFTITVEDREKPVLTVPANFTRTVEPGQFGTAVDYLVTATDNSGSASVICLPASGAIFPLGLTMVTCTATDAVGNSATNAFMVMVIDTSIPDTQPPVITVPDNIVVSNDPGQSNAVVTYTVTVTDNLPGAMVMCVPPTGSTFPVGTTVVVCSAIDLAGNHSTNGFTVTVQDREKPVLNVPANITVVAEAGKLSAVIDYTATATDNSGSVAVVCVPPSGTAFPIGVTTVTCTAIDDAGNVATGSFTVTVISGTQPPGSCWVVPSKPVLCPTGKMIPVSLWLTQKDFKKKLKFSSVRIVSVTSNEPETGLSPDDIGPDWQIVDADKLKLKLRAERGDNGTGRIYTITVEAMDPKGNVSTCTATVTVPLRKTGKKAK